MEIDVNGQPRELRSASTVLDLLRDLDLTPDTVVVERNQQLVPAADFAVTALATGDRLEILRFVGGG